MPVPAQQSAQQSAQQTADSAVSGVMGQKKGGAITNMGAAAQVSALCFWKIVSRRHRHGMGNHDA